MHGAKMLGYPKGKKTKEKFRAKVGKVLHEAKEGKLHSGSDEGPIVTKPSQKIAIALSEGRRAVAKKGKK